MMPLPPSTPTFSPGPQFLLQVEMWAFSDVVFLMSSCINALKRELLFILHLLSCPSQLHFQFPTPMSCFFLVGLFDSIPADSLLKASSSRLGFLLFPFQS